MTGPTAALAAPMTPPAWGSPARWFFRRLARARVAGALDGLHVSGLDLARESLARGPVIFACTHVAWWDVFVLLLLDEALGGRGRALMDAENLDRLPFFRWVGALPLDRSGGARARSGLRDAAAWPDAPGKALWVFPQGRQRPAHLRPLGLARGIVLLARTSGAPVVPVALDYGFREGERPAAVVRFGAPLTEARDLLPALEVALADGLSHVDRFLDGQPAEFQALVPPARPRGDVDLPTRLLAALARRLG